ncbi:biopolymer transporter ExbD [Rhodopirellula sp. MGV]|uniref:biopolymer transporter ExbD n=1 Tax=Rhodopirellula sp. MGV TaxID=2023130 RepID=UPI000B96F293|nr:biopolymer transporter ExbD [Rhodopirellula sp. MGV]OYP35989.1 biopolymer transporter ExbD [Rhodopirellula sp. MGV]PNY36654.1 biopolymer transporter ExbD [Rhodopirellula baltica]
MSIPVTCPQCGAINKVNDSLAGRRVRCPECDTAVHVPEPEAAIEVEAIDVDVIEAEPVVAAALSGQSGVPSTPTPIASVPVTDANVALADLDEDDDEEVLKRKPRDEEELDMTPMVDVTFLLLIFFMVTAAFSLQKSIQMPRQQTDAPSTTVVEQEEEDLTPIELQVDEYGSFLVLAADWQEETPGKQNLISTLKRANTGGPMRLVIKVHEMCKLQFLVDAMDAGTIAGFTETQVTQVEEFD